MSNGLIDFIPETAENTNLFYLKFSNKPELVTLEETEFALGYKEVKPPSGINLIIEDMIEQISNLSDLKAGYIVLKTKKTEENSNGIFIEDAFLNTGNLITGQLADSSTVAIFVCSIGNTIESYIQNLMDDEEIAKGYIADTIASIAADNFAKKIHEHIQNKAENDGLKTTNRYSPGYCSWDVSEQHKLFSLLPDNFCGIKLTESAFMIPRKSVSGIIGIGENVKFNKYLCNDCISSECTYRQTHKYKEKK